MKLFILEKALRLLRVVQNNLDRLFYKLDGCYWELSREEILVGKQ